MPDDEHDYKVSPRRCTPVFGRAGPGILAAGTKRTFRHPWSTRRTTQIRRRKAARPRRPCVSAAWSINCGRIDKTACLPDFRHRSPRHGLSRSAAPDRSRQRSRVRYAASLPGYWSTSLTRAIHPLPAQQEVRRCSHPLPQRCARVQAPPEPLSSRANQAKFLFPFFGGFCQTAQHFRDAPGLRDAPAWRKRWLSVEDFAD
jgi:hypothetical protein